MNKILFVDDEPEILMGLKRMLRSKRNEWDARYAGSGREALNILSREPFDVIVSDSSMPEMDGAQLFKEVQERHPTVIRIFLSGVSDQNQIMRLVRSAHQFLAKPIDKDNLYRSLKRAFAVKHVMDNPALVELISSLDSLPSLPAVYLQVTQAINEQKSLEEIGRIIETDIGMSANILKLVNSAFFGIPRNVYKPSEAVRLLGIDIVESLVLSYQLFKVFDISAMPGFSFEFLWNHCLRTAKLARTLAADLGLDHNAQEKAFVSGILHDVGKLIFGSQIAERYTGILARVRAGEAMLWEAELEELGTTHAEAGAYLMGLWGIPDEIVLAMAYHHRPELAETDLPGIDTALYAANVLEHELIVINKDYARPSLNETYLEKLGLLKRISHWKKICRSVLSSGGPDDAE